MIDKIYKKFNRPKLDKATQIELYKKRFFAHAGHQWIENDPYMKRVFNILIDHFNQDLLDFIDKNGEIVFSKSTGKFACAISANNDHNTIVVFPDLIKILKSAYINRGLAILSHEIGHLYYEHSKRKLYGLESQVEADYFAIKLGLGHDLQDFLLDYESENTSSSLDIRVRIAKITSVLITQTS